MDINTLPSDNYHNRILTKLFKMEWNIRRIANMSREAKDPRDIEPYREKLEKIIPDISWNNMDILDQKSITEHRNKARRLLQKKRREEEQKAIIEAIRQREMSFASNKKWGIIID